MLSVKYIHDYIGDSFRAQLSDFSYIKSRKQVERKLDIRTDVISWQIGKYGDTFHVSFCVLIRHHKIDGLYEKLFHLTAGKEYAIWDNFSELGDNEQNTQYHIKSENELVNVISQVIAYMQKHGVSFFDMFKSDFDFYSYLCVNKQISSYSEVFGLKRIMFCFLSNKKALNDLNAYNIQCCTLPPSGTDFYINSYYEGLSVLENHYGKMPFEFQHINN